MGLYVALRTFLRAWRIGVEEFLVPITFFMFMSVVCLQADMRLMFPYWAPTTVFNGLGFNASRVCCCVDLARSNCREVVEYRIYLRHKSIVQKKSQGGVLRPKMSSSHCSRTRTFSQRSHSPRLRRRASRKWHNVWPVRAATIASLRLGLAEIFNLPSSHVVGGHQFSARGSGVC